ncbi:transposase [Streptosporangium sp. NBC_01810]|uniref:Tn3 family transposase n=1 Tax=Streptosporangium sp. NBC_01810 TaxID=2975951 RepID=UPI002DDB4828|nr:Tn3 family transposase [Streptosporangium sp. NBC_01810]WSA28638.1 transposase [Streptosporangium sp. NBC_01810]
MSLANVPLVEMQANLPLAQAWGGGLVAAVDGMRFVVPVPAAFARPNRKYFGSKRGMTWLNAMKWAELHRIQRAECPLWGMARPG